MYTQTNLELPEPSYAERTLSTQLCKKIAKAICQHNGSISFANFMHMALYHEQLGYYTNDRIKFGAKGDFVTAPTLGNLFAISLATQFAELITKIPHCHIIEFGAGNGQLAHDLLTHLESLNCLPQKYLIIEISTNLKKQQKNLLSKLPTKLFNLVKWATKVENSPNSIVIANEVLDAFAIERLYRINNTIQQCQVQNTKQNFAVTYTALPLDKTNILKDNGTWQHLLTNPPGYTCEYNFYASIWLHDLFEKINIGVLFICDYGYNKTAYYHAQKSSGTLMCHYKHHAHSDPLFYPGLQDISSHINFSQLADDISKIKNTYILGYTHLAGFLINCRIYDYIDNDPRQQHELLTLSSPAYMGEVFKVMAVSKNFIPNNTLVGFTNFDKSHSLLDLT